MAIGRDAVFIARPCRLILLRELAGEAYRVARVTASVIGDHIGMSAQNSSPPSGWPGRRARNGAGSCSGASPLSTHSSIAAR